MDVELDAQFMIRVNTSLLVFSRHSLRFDPSIFMGSSFFKTLSFADHDKVISLSVVSELFYLGITIGILTAKIVFILVRGILISTHIVEGGVTNIEVLGPPECHEGS